MCSSVNRILIFQAIFSLNVLNDTPLRADDEPRESTPTPATAPLTPAEISRLLRDLDHAEFDVREQATKKLVAAGPAVIPAVAKAADGDSLEVATRCVSILKDLHSSRDDKTREAATSALQELTKSRHRSVARRATEILNPAAENPPAADLPNVLPGLPAAPFHVRVRSKTTNGSSEIDIDENGTQIKIKHQGGKNISVVITPPAENGKAPKPAEFQAGDAAELKDKHPEAHQYFERYGQRGRPGPGNPLFPGAPPQIPPPLIPQPPNARPAGFPDNPARRAVTPPQLRPPFPDFQPDSKESKAPAANASPNSRAAAASRQKELENLLEQLKTAIGKPVVDQGELQRLLQELEKFAAPAEENRKTKPSGP